MLNLICIVLIINTYIMCSESTQISEFNETRVILSLRSQLAELQKEVTRLGKLVNDSIKETDPHNLISHGRNCAESTVNSKKSGIYEILIPSYSKDSFRVFCDTTSHGGGWTVILSRLDGSENFHRNWNTYKKGFGNLDGEFFLGLDKIHALTADYSQELLVVLEDFNGLEAYETYDRFGITDENEQYALNTLGVANGTAGDSLSYHFQMKFSTFDQDNDLRDNENCAILDTGAWWYKNCQYSNLAATYKENFYQKGVNWQTFRGWESSLKKAVMMIRPRKL